LGEVWKSFKQRFELYMKTTNTTALPSEQKVALLLTVAGTEALEIFNSFQLTEQEGNNYDIVMSKFESYCMPWVNENYERFVFNSRVQLPNESIEEFVTDLKLQSRSCNFGQIQESLIRDRLVIGCSDHKVPDCLLRDCELTLEKAIRICQAVELRKKQIINKNKMHHRKVEQKETHKHTKGKSCGKCGNVHEYRNCPAFGKKCKFCGKYNHFARQCKSKSNLHAIYSLLRLSSYFEKKKKRITQSLRFYIVFLSFLLDTMLHSHSEF
uniref:CCHC-type domain-containing protein n=1 Tax=Latimeria chalumnae TaxID=7897 RepID=H3A369_LATCH